MKNFSEAGFKHLRIWQEAHSLMLTCWGIANKISFKERSKADQLKRSSSAPPDNIAECYGSYYLNDKIKSLHVSRKEATETQNHILSLIDLGLLSKEDGEKIIRRYEGLIIGINIYRSKIIKTRNSRNPKG